jgi:C4-dicarboxylate transporter
MIADSKVKIIELITGIGLDIIGSIAHHVVIEANKSVTIHLPNMNNYIKIMLSPFKAKV